MISVIHSFRQSLQHKNVHIHFVCFSFASSASPTFGSLAQGGSTPPTFGSVPQGGGGFGGFGGTAGGGGGGGGFGGASPGNLDC